MRDRVNTLPDASHLLIAGLATEPEKSSPHGMPPIRYWEPMEPRQSLRDYCRILCGVSGSGILRWEKFVILIAFVFAAPSLYWEAFHDMQNNLRAVEVHAVDFDGEVSPSNNVTAIVEPDGQYIHRHGIVRWVYHVISPAQHDYSPIEVGRHVYNWGVWAAIIVNPNATALLFEAVRSGNTSWRHPLNHFGTRWSWMLLANNFSPTVMAKAPTAVNPGVVSYHVQITTTDNEYYSANSHSSARALDRYSNGNDRADILDNCGLLLVFVSTEIRTNLTPTSSLLASDHMALVRYVNLVSIHILNIFTSIPRPRPAILGGSGICNRRDRRRDSLRTGTLPSLLDGELGGDDDARHRVRERGHGSEQPWTALWIILRVITNIAMPSITSSSPPMLRVETCLATIGFNFGLLFAWTVVNTAFLPLCCYFMRWHTEHEQREASMVKDRYLLHFLEGDYEFLRKEGTQRNTIITYRHDATMKTPRSSDRRYYGSKKPTGRPNCPPTNMLFYLLTIVSVSASLGTHLARFHGFT
ncbi:hypothetical protein CIB48_g8925 [Xylaria polymorpha]|nr:hypothetical protein CIB48_g8925 [Xylaria polymorpha]